MDALANNIFASTYTYVIPEKEKLIAQVEAVLNEWDCVIDKEDEVDKSWFFKENYGIN